MKTKRLYLSSNILGVVGRLESALLQRGLGVRGLFPVNLIRLGVALLGKKHTSDKVIVKAIKHYKRKYNISDDLIVMSNDAEQIYRGAILGKSEFAVIERILQLYVVKNGAIGNATRIGTAGYSSTELNLLVLVALRFLEENLDSPKCNKLLDNVALDSRIRNDGAFIRADALIETVFQDVSMTDKAELADSVKLVKTSRFKSANEQREYFFKRASEMIDKENPNLPEEERYQAILEKRKELIENSRYRRAKVRQTMLKRRETVKAKKDAENGTPPTHDDDIDF